MKTKAPLPFLALSGRSQPPIIEAYFELNHLKQLYRQGWLRRGIPPERCESVAEHVFAMAMLGWWIVDAAFPELDREKVLRMTLVHELGEIYTGDLIPSDNIPTAEKHHLERVALHQVVDRLPNGPAYVDLWEEYEQGQTAEARFVRQLDRLEMAFQAAIYQQDFGSLDEFFATTDAALVDPRLREIFEQLRAINS